MCRYWNAAKGASAALNSGYDCGCRPKVADALKWTAGICPPSGVSPLVVPCRIRKPGAVADFQMGNMKAGVCRFSSVPWGPNGVQMSSVAVFGGTYAMQQICVTDIAKNGCEYAREGGGGRGAAAGCLSGGKGGSAGS